MIPDLISLLGSVVCIIADKPIIGKYFELIRFFSLNKALYPVELLVSICSSKGQKRASQIQQLIIIFFMFFMLAHMATCFWIYLGFVDKDKPPEERKSWIYVNDLYGSDGYGNAYTKSNSALYVFSLYWVFSILTKGGYDDYSGGTGAEVLVTLLYELVGFGYSAILISYMGNIFASDFDHNALIEERLDEMNLWMKRIERSYKPYYMPRILARRMQESI